MTSNENINWKWLWICLAWCNSHKRASLSFKRRGSRSQGLWVTAVPCKRRSLVVEVSRRAGVDESCVAKAKKRKKWRKMLYHCNFICVSLKHGIHGSLRRLKTLYIHNCWNPFFCPRTVVKFR